MHLLARTEDKLAAELGLDPGSYDRDYYGLAFQLLDDPGACERMGPQTTPLVGMGGQDRDYALIPSVSLLCHAASVSSPAQGS